MDDIQASLVRQIKTHFHFSLAFSVLMDSLKTDSFEVLYFDSFAFSAALDNSGIASDSWVYDATLHALSKGLTLPRKEVAKCRFFDYKLSLCLKFSASFY